MAVQTAGGGPRAATEGRAGRWWATTPIGARAWVLADEAHHQYAAYAEESPTQTWPQIAGLVALIWQLAEQARVEGQHAAAVEAMAALSDAARVATWSALAAQEAVARYGR